MNKHITVETSTDLSRRSFIVGTSAAGLALGFASVPGSSALAAPATPATFDPSV